MTIVLMITVKNLLGLPAKRLNRVLQNIVVRDSGCWEWTGGKTPKGYGRVYCAGVSESQVLTHRLIYLLEVGPVPDGVDLHHRETCSKACANPEHLTPLGHAAHTLVTNADREYFALTHCKRGHEFTEDSVTVYRGKRQCKTCQNLLRREKTAAKPPRDAKTHCKSGHEFTPDNTVMYLQHGTMRRGCKACRMAAVKRYQGRNRSTIKARERIPEKLRRGITTFTAMELASGSIHLPSQS